MCLRWALRWEEHTQALEQAVMLAGQSGDFGLQTEIILERCISSRLRGHLGQAAADLGRTLNQAVRYKLDAIAVRARIEAAQLALETQDAESMLAALEGLPASNHEIWLRAEAFCLLGRFDECAAVIALLRATGGLSLSFRARLHALMAQIHRSRTAMDEARLECESAVTLLEQTDDMYNLARAYLNLGTAILESGGKPDAAVEVYERAQALQNVVGDAVMRFATTHNLNIAHLRS